MAFEGFWRCSELHHYKHTISGIYFFANKARVDGVLVAPLGGNGNNLLLLPLTFIWGTAGVDVRAARPLMTSGDLSHSIRSYLHHAVVRGSLYWHSPWHRTHVIYIFSQYCDLHCSKEIKWHCNWTYDKLAVYLECESSLNVKGLASITAVLSLINSYYKTKLISDRNTFARIEARPIRIPDHGLRQWRSPTQRLEEICAVNNQTDAQSQAVNSGLQQIYNAFPPCTLFNDESMELGQ